MRIALALLVSVGIGLGLGCIPTSAQSELPGGRIVANGKGSAVALPDMAFISVSFSALKPSPQAALEAGAAMLAPLTAALKDLKVEDRDVQSSNLSLQPKYGPDGCGSTYADEPVPCALLGFEMNTSLAVRVRDLDSLSNVLAIFATSEGGRIRDVTLSSSQPEVPNEQAYVDALLKARQRGELTATTLGVSLGDIVEVRETSSDYGTNRPATLADGIVYQSEGGSADLIVPLPRGELTFNRQVQVTWAIAPAE